MCMLPTPPLPIEVERAQLPADGLRHTAHCYPPSFTHSTGAIPIPQSAR
ncbi:hypothetical protein M3J09_011995 [Ascochyta lentis]